MDLRISSDGEIVVIHDRTVDRTTDGRGEVSNMDLPTLRKLDAGGGESIPVLNEVIHLAREYDATLFLEVKVPSIGELLIPTLREEDFLNNSVIFGPPDLVNEIHDIDPEVNCTEPGRFRVGIHDLSPGGIAGMHRRGLVLIHGDIDEEEEMRRLISLGLDGIITNYPNHLAGVHESTREE
jgi:glycerophosphoryl diester phosphodiesterase